MMHIAEVVEKRALTPAVRHVGLRLADASGFSFRPGQFIQFVLDERTLRQFSIASVPAKLPLIELCVDISPMGRGSRFIEGLELGDRVTFRGPFGVFTVPPAETRPLEFVATGAGIAPIRAMIFEVFERVHGAPSPVTLTFGNRTPSDAPYHDEWQALAARNPTFRYSPTLSQPSADWQGLQGRVTDALQSRKAEFPGRTFFLCGNPEMVDDARKLLGVLGIPEADVHFEKFY